MVMAPIEVRQLRVGEEAAAGALIRASGPEIFDPVLGPDARRCVGALTTLLQRGGALFCREHTWVAVEGDTVVGAMVAYPPTIEPEQGWAFLRYTLQGVGLLRSIRRFCFQLAMAVITRGVRMDALYLASLAVDPKRRGAGIGALLLGALSREARESGCRAIEADVTLKNTQALRFYERVGFRVVARRRARLLRLFLGFTGYHRIRQEL